MTLPASSPPRLSPGANPVLLLPPAVRLRRRLLLGASIGAPLLIPVLWHWSPVLAILQSFAAHMVWCYAVLRPNCRWLGPVVSGFEPDNGAREVWLTIDDGPDPVDNPHLLDLLERFDARATFFLVGDRARACPEAVRALLARGHGVGNHTETHPQGSFWVLPRCRVICELDAANATLASLNGNGGAPVLFRPPVGMQNPTLAPLLAARGMRLVGWSARGFDGVAHEPGEAIARILRDVRPGAILLLHEGRRGTDGEPLNILGLELLLSALRERGYAAVIPRPEQLRPR